jgi:hypothetical protein
MPDESTGFADRPSPGLLWLEAGGDDARYRELLREHGLLLSPGDPGYDEAPRTLPCGWQPGKPRAEQRRCEITELLVDSCAHCNGAERRQQEQERAGWRREGWGPWFTAGRHGRCAGPCDEDIKPGDRIRSNGERGWLCASCGEDESS